VTRFIGHHDNRNLRPLVPERIAGTVRYAAGRVFGLVRARVTG